MKETIKRYAVSSLVTFFTGFVLAVAPSLSDLSVDVAKEGVLLGILLVGVRAGVKMVIEEVSAKL